MAKDEPGCHDGDEAKDEQQNQSSDDDGAQPRGGCLSISLQGSSLIVVLCISLGLVIDTSFEGGMGRC